MTATEINAAMMRKLDRADSLHLKLTAARERGAPLLVVTGLQMAYDQSVAAMNELWDSWNEQLLRERLQRI